MILAERGNSSNSWSRHCPTLHRMHTFPICQNVSSLSSEDQVAAVSQNPSFSLSQPWVSYGPVWNITSATTELLTWKFYLGHPPTKSVQAESLAQSVPHTSKFSNPNLPTFFFSFFTTSGGKKHFRQSSFCQFGFWSNFRSWPSNSQLAPSAFQRVLLSLPSISCSPLL